MTTQICRWPFAIIWRIHPDDPRAVQWRHNELGARWRDWRAFDTPEQARAAMHENGKRQVVPEEVDA